MYFDVGDRVKINNKKHICIATNKRKVAVFSPYLEMSGGFGKKPNFMPTYSDMKATPNILKDVNFEFEWIRVEKTKRETV